MTLPYTTQKSSLGQRGDETSSHLDQYVRDRALMMHKHLFQQQLARQQQQQQQQQRQQQQQMQQMQQQQQQSNSHPLSNDFELFDSRQQRHAPVPEDQKPLHQSTGNSASLAQYQARLAELEGQNRKRLLMAREDQDPWAQAPNTWSLSSDVPPATRKDTYDVIEDTEKIKVRYHQTSQVEYG
jgi:transcription initiation factor TFIID subunit TAF12